MMISSLYVVNHMVYIFGAKYISVKRISIEFVIQFTYCVFHILDNNYKWLWHVNILLIISIILECKYYVICTYFYDANKTPQTHVISNEVLQVLGVINIMMGIFYSFLNSFNYDSCIQALQCVAPAIILLLGSLISVDER